MEIRALQRIQGYENASSSIQTRVTYFRRFQSVPGANFLQHAVYMVLDGLIRKIELSGDLFVR